MSKMGPVNICSQGIMKQATISKCVLLQLQKNVSCSNYRDNNSYDQSRMVLQNLNKSKPHKEVWNTLWSHKLIYMHIYHIYIVLESGVSTKNKKQKTKNKHCLLVTSIKIRTSRRQTRLATSKTKTSSRARPCQYVRRQVCVH